MEREKGKESKQEGNAPQNIKQKILLANAEETDKKIMSYLVHLFSLKHSYEIPDVRRE